MTTYRFTAKHILRTAALLIAACLPASADPMSLGILSFDSILPGVSDQFTISNMSGLFDLPSDFPVTTAVTFQNAQLTLFGPSAPVSPILLGDIGPGAAATGLFSDASQFTSAVFTATLGPTTLSLDGGGAETVDSFITATLLPSSGSLLVADTDLTVIEAAAPAPSSVPEPSAFALIVSLAGILAVLSWRRRRVPA